MDGLRIDQRVEGGETAADYDAGRVTAIDGDQVTVAWDSGVETIQHASLIRPEGSRALTDETA
jgi:hypothetical protein